LKKIFSLPSWNRKYLLVIIPALLVVLAGWGGYWFQRASRRESLAARIPASAIGYVEVTSLAALVGDLSATPAWRELAGADGREVADALSGLRRLALTVSGDELTVLTGSQLALVLTAVEVREQEVRPRLALLVEPGQRSERIGEWLEQRLRALAGRLYGEGRVETRTGSYAGVETVGYHPRDTGTGEESAMPGWVGLRRSPAVSTGGRHDVSWQGWSRRTRWPQSMVSLASFREKVWSGYCDPRPIW
jgi:hypothetical protein